ncbi:Uncharacterised protein [uncultured archaeon]|nr:Uncharacterised protein [uncultured archaeon]
MKMFAQPIATASPDLAVRMGKYYFSKRQAPLKSGIFNDLTNPQLNESYAEEIKKKVTPGLKSFFQKTKKVDIKVIERRYPHFSDLMRKIRLESPIPAGEPDDYAMYREAHSTFGISNVEDGLAYINKELILERCGRNPELQKAFFTLTVIHEIYHHYGAFPVDFQLKSPNGKICDIRTDFLNEGICEYFARGSMYAVFPKEWRLIHREEMLNKAERIYAPYHDIAFMLDKLLGIGNIIDAFKKGDTSVICRALMKINLKEGFEFIESSSQLSEEFSGGEPRPEKLAELKKRIEKAFRHLYEGMPDLKHSEGEFRAQVFPALRQSKLLAPEGFGGEKIRDVEGLIKYLTGLFPDSSDYDQYLLGECAALVCAFKNRSNVNHKDMAKTIYDYSKSFEQYHGVFPPNTGRLLEYMADKKLAEFSGKKTKYLKNFEKMAAELLGPDSDKKYVWSDCVAIGKALGIASSEHKPESMRTLIDHVAVEFWRTNNFSLTRKDVAAFLICHASDIDMGTPDAIEKITDKLVKIHEERGYNMGSMMGHVSNEEFLAVTSHYLHSIGSNSVKEDADALVRLVAFTNTYVHPECYTDVNKEYGVIRSDKNGLLMTLYSYELIKESSASIQTAKRRENGI